MVARTVYLDHLTLLKRWFDNGMPTLTETESEKSGWTFISRINHMPVSYNETRKESSCLQENSRGKQRGICRKLAQLDFAKQFTVVNTYLVHCSCNRTTWGIGCLSIVCRPSRIWDRVSTLRTSVFWFHEMESDRPQYSSTRLHPSCASQCQTRTLPCASQDPVLGDG